MGRYLLRRLFLIFPTLFGILLINFAIIQLAPGGPIDQIIAQSSGLNMSTTQAVSAGGQMGGSGKNTSYGASGLPPDMLEALDEEREEYS